MGLREAMQKAAEATVGALGTVGVSTNYQAFASTTYNASAGSAVAAYSTTAGVTVIFDEFRLEQIDGEHVKPEDKKALIPSRSISGVTPKVNDRVVDGDGTWTVVRVNADPAEALWTLQVRR